MILLKSLGLLWCVPAGFCVCSKETLFWKTSPVLMWCVPAGAFFSSKKTLVWENKHCLMIFLRKMTKSQRIDRNGSRFDRLGWNFVQLNDFLIIKTLEIMVEQFRAEQKHQTMLLSLPPIGLSQGIWSEGGIPLTRYLIPVCDGIWVWAGSGVSVSSCCRVVVSSCWCLRTMWCGFVLYSVQNGPR